MNLMPLPGVLFEVAGSSHAWMNVRLTRFWRKPLCLAERPGSIGHDLSGVRRDQPVRNQQGGKTARVSRVFAGRCFSEPGYLRGGAGVDDAAGVDDEGGLFEAAGASGQSGSALPASQSSAVVRPPRASAIVTEDINATNARAAVSLRMELSIGFVHHYVGGLRSGTSFGAWNRSNRPR